jgi:hypothetical protein
MGGRGVQNVFPCPLPACPAPLQHLQCYPGLPGQMCHIALLHSHIHFCLSPPPVTPLQLPQLGHVIKIFPGLART